MSCGVRHSAAYAAECGPCEMYINSDDKKGVLYPEKCIAIRVQIWYYNRAQRRNEVNIRVWRRLVARLNGVQEAAGSTPVTRTICKVPKVLGFSRVFGIFVVLVKFASMPIVCQFVLY